LRLAAPALHHIECMNQRIFHDAGEQFLRICRATLTNFFVKKHPELLPVRFRRIGEPLNIEIMVDEDHRDEAIDHCDVFFGILAARLPRRFTAVVEVRGRITDVLFDRLLFLAEDGERIIRLCQIPLFVNSLSRCLFSVLRLEAA
jgi:hypothetical protein